MKPRIWIALLVVLTVLAAWWQWRRAVPAVQAAANSPLSPLVRVVSSDSAAPDQVLRERAELLDPTPLFFPTEWNYGLQPERAARLGQPGQVFGSFEPKLTVGEQTMAPFRLEGTPVPEKLSDVLSQGSEASFDGMGQIDRQRSTLPVRSGHLEVRDLASGNLIISQSLTGISPPRGDFAPLEFLVTVSSGGMVGDPVLTTASEGEDVDSFFRDYLLRSYRLGERLLPGRYRVLVGT
jgi:hypothetical protein